MKVKELIEHLKQFDGDLEVYSFCNHGQSPEKSSVPSEIFVNHTDHCLWDEWAYDPDDAEEHGYSYKAVLL